MWSVQYIEINQVKEWIDKGHKNIKLQWNNQQQIIDLKKVQVGYGQRTFFICPCCGQNAIKLYFYKDLYRCVNCCTVKPYYGIQNTTKGGYEYLTYKIYRFAKKCGIPKVIFPFNYSDYIKPKGKHQDKWNNNLKILQALENMRMQSILYNKIWKPKTIKSVEQGRNKFLILNLYELQRYFQPFDTGVL